MGNGGEGGSELKKREGWFKFGKEKVWKEVCGREREECKREGCSVVGGRVT